MCAPIHSLGAIQQRQAGCVRSTAHSIGLQVVCPVKEAALELGSLVCLQGLSSHNTEGEGTFVNHFADNHMCK